MAKYMDKLLRVFGITVQKEEEPEEVQPTKYEVAHNYRSISEDELKVFSEQVRIEGKQRKLVEDLPKMLEPLTADLQKKRIDNEKLIALAPEIDQAASILIPSILSPNDMRTNQFNLTIKAETEDENTLSEITKMLLNVFNDELKLNSKLYHWLYATMFRSGAKPLFVLPSDLLPKIDTLSKASIESFCQPISLSSGSGYTAALESLSLPEGGRKLVGNASTIADTIEKEAGLFFTDNLVVMDFSTQQYTDKMNTSSARFTASIEELWDAPDTTDKESIERHKLPFINMNDFLKESDKSQYPSIIELPYEAVIPIIIEGAPSNHIGYFILLNEQGIPISATINDGDSDKEIENLNNTSGSKRIDDLYKAFYGSSYTAEQKKLSNDLKSQVVESVYSEYLDSALNEKLDDMQMGSFSIGLTQDVINVMFTRLMRHTKTSVLFVPNELVTYIAFEFNDNGTGRSKIDNIKFPLSLKLTLIITRLISLIESSVNRRKLSVTFDDNIANPIETLQAIRKEIMKKKLHGISYDPNTIISSALDKELTVVPQNIPGIENFDISDEPNTVDYPRADDSLLEEINNMYILSLGVSPNSLNRFNEDDFAISIATNNLYMANQTRISQNVVSSCMTKLLKVFIKYSSKMKADITEILKASEVDQENDSDPEVLAVRLKNVVNGIQFTLPKPNIAFDKSQFEQIREYFSIIDEILNTTMADDMMDRDSQDDIKQLRAYAKRQMAMDYLHDNSAFGSDFKFDVFEEIEIEEILDVSQTMMNFKKASTALKEKLAGGGDSGGGGGGYGGY